MSRLSITHHEELQHSVGERYKRQGYEVEIEPGTSAIPFDVGGYAPDLIARKGEVTLIIGIKTQPDRVSFEQLKSVVDAVKRHDGWRFVLVTSQDVGSLDLPDETEDPFSWEDVRQRIEDAERLNHQGQETAAYLTWWIAFERMMRFQARRVGLPVDRLAPSIVIRQLYSQGELSIAQFDSALLCQAARNRIVHGYRAADFNAAITQLGTLVSGSWTNGQIKARMLDRQTGTG